MPSYNLYEVIKTIFEDIKYQLDDQGVDRQSVDNILNDLIESINRNVKFKRSEIL